MLIATGSCCCSPVSDIYVGTVGSRIIYQFKSDTGANSIWKTFSNPINPSSIACNPNNSRIYIASSLAVNCFDKLGNQIWGTSLSGPVIGVAVTNEGSVYACTSAGVIHKLNETTGVAITTGWPYSPGGGAAFQVCCADQSGNIYAGGDNTAKSLRAVSLTPSGSVRWTSAVTNNAGLETGSFGTICMSVNSDGTEVACARKLKNPAPAGLNSLYLLNASSGGISSSVGPTGSTGAFSGNGSGYDSLGNSYLGILDTVPSSGHLLYKNLAAYLSYPTTPFPNALAISRNDNDIYFASSGVVNFSAAMVYSLNKGWSVEIPTQSQFNFIELSSGRIGAFGPG